jgi:transposase InsO family protein
VRFPRATRLNADKRRRSDGNGALSEDERTELARLRTENADLGQGRDGAVAVAALIAAQRDEHRIPHATACRALGVSRSWYYKHKDRKLTPRQARRQALAAEIGRLFKAHRGTYGSPRITADLRAAGWQVSKNTVAAIMGEQGLAARRKKKRRSTTRPGKGRWRAPDLVKRDFPAATLNTKWYGDGTQIKTGQGKLYLSVTWNHRACRRVELVLAG